MQHIEKEIEKKIKDLEIMLENEKEEKISLLEEIEELRRIRTYYEALMQNTEDYILICDSNGVSQAFNAKYKQRCEQLLNIEIKPGMQTHRLSGNAEAIKYWDSLQERALKGEQFIAEYSDEERDIYFETLFSPIRDGKKVTGFIEITRNITERKRIEKALKESDSFSSSLLEYSPTAIVVYNPDTSVRYVNPFFEKLTGFSSRDVLGLKHPYPWSVDDTKYGSIEKRQKEGVKRSEREYRKKSGEHAWAEIDVTPIYRDGELVYSLGTWIDISDRKNTEQEKERLQRQLQQAQRWRPSGKPCRRCCK
jgi:PAS domain S-box-containing protein